jgi:hypothetical protein
MNSKKYFFLTIFIIFFINISKSKQLSNNVVASIDNVIITELDIYKESNFIKFISKSQNLNLNNLRNESLHNLIDRTVKSIEVNSFKIEISDKEIEIALYNYLSNQKITVEDLNIFYKENEIEEDYLKNVIKNDMKWSKLIRSLYANRININLTEINKDLEKESQNSVNNEELKNKLINSEQNILLNKFSSTHLDRSKKKYLIKLL